VAKDGGFTTGEGTVARDEGASLQGRGLWLRVGGFTTGGGGGCGSLMCWSLRFSGKGDAASLYPPGGQKMRPRR
jgi:hypothetical protein